MLHSPLKTQSSNHFKYDEQTSSVPCLDMTAETRYRTSTTKGFCCILQSPHQWMLISQSVSHATTGKMNLLCSCDQGRGATSPQYALDLSQHLLSSYHSPAPSVMWEHMCAASYSTHGRWGCKARRCTWGRFPKTEMCQLRSLRGGKKCASRKNKQTRKGKSILNENQHW